MSAASLLLALSGAVVFYLLFLVVPSAMATLFRNRLWRLRDALAADVRAGRFAGHLEAPQGLYKEIDLVIHHGADLSPAKALVFNLLALGTPRTAAWSIDFSTVTNLDDRTRLEKYERQLFMAMVAHFFLGSPSGWGVSIILLIVTPLIVLAKFTMRILSGQWRNALKGSVRDSVNLWEREAYETQVDVLPQIAALRHA